MVFDKNVKSVQLQICVCICMFMCAYVEVYICILTCVRVFVYINIFTSGPQVCSNHLKPNYILLVYIILLMCLFNYNVSLLMIGTVY